MPLTCSGVGAACVDIPLIKWGGWTGLPNAKRGTKGGASLANFAGVRKFSLGRGEAHRLIEAHSPRVVTGGMAPGGLSCSSALWRV